MRSASSVFLLALLSIVGCEGGSGTLLVQPDLRAISCDEVDLLQVTIGEIQDAHPCIDRDALIIPGIPAGDYENFTVRALDGDGKTFATSASRSLTVERDETTTVRPLVNPTPAELVVDLALRDDDGFNYDEGEASPITEVHILADGVRTVSHSAKVSGNTQIEVSDPEGDLVGTRLQRLRMDVIADGVSYPVTNHGGGEVFAISPTGHGGRVVVEVECKDVRCYFGS